MHHELAPPAATSAAPSRPLPPPWLFFFLALPQGIFQGYIATALPWMLRESGVGVEAIATLSATVGIPTMLLFLWAPVVDITGRRKLCLLIAAAGSAAALFASNFLPTGNLALLTVVLFAGQVLNTLVSSSNGALMAATLSPEARGRAAGWLQGGNVGGGAIGAGLILLLLQQTSVEVAATIGALAVFLPALAALAVHEPRRAAGGGFQRLRQAIRDTAGSRSMAIGFALFLSPLGAAALLNLLSSVAQDYQAPPILVTVATGFAGGLFTATGAVAGGYISDRMSRMHAFLLSSIANGLCALLMFACPLTPEMYAIGTALYLFSTGICYATWGALALDLVGEDRGSGATRYTLLVAAANMPISYMTWADGQGYDLFGVRGLLAFDGIASIVPAVLVLGLLWWARANRNSRALPIAKC